MNFPPPGPGQARVIWLALTGLALALLVALVAGLVWVLGRVIQALSPVLWPLAVAGVIAYLLDPVVDFLERKGTGRARAIIGVFALALMIVVLVFSSIVPQIVLETRKLTESVPEYVDKAQTRLNAWINSRPMLLRLLHSHPESAGTNAPALTTNAQGVVEVTNTSPPSAGAQGTNNPSVLQGAFQPGNFPMASDWAAKTLPKIGSWLFGQVGKVASWLGVLAGVALVPVYAFYFLLEKRGISSRWTNYLPVTDSEFKQELVFILSSINNYLISFFRGQVLVAMTDGILYTIGFVIVGVPYAVLIGAASILLTMIPFLGAIVTCITALVLTAVQYGDWKHPLLVGIVFAIVQALEGAVVSPKIMGNRVGLHPVTIIVAVMVGTTLLGGILGGVLAIPLTAALRVVMFRYVWKERTPAT